MKQKVSYVLIISIVKNLEVSIRKHHYILDPGFYLYIGSARIKRPYLRVLRHKVKVKKIKWHIDYITSKDYTKCVGIICYGMNEDELYDMLNSLSSVKPIIKGFGTSDRRNHISHLFKLKSLAYINDILKRLFISCDSVEMVM